MVRTFFLARSACALFLALVTLTAALADHVAKTYQLENVEWHVTLHPENATIDGDVTNTIRLLGDRKSVQFDCGPLAVSKVAVDGIEASYTWHPNVLDVVFEGGTAGSTHRIEIKYSGKPTAGLYYVAGKSAYPGRTPVAYTQGQSEDNRYWLPTYDFPDNKATSESYITVPNGWRALSNGKAVDQKTFGTMTTFHWKMEQPQSTYLLSLVAGPFDVGHETWRGIPVDYWVPEGLADWGKATFSKTTPKLIELYSKLTGFKYPYVKFTQAAVPDFMFGGMENTTCVTQTLSAVYPPELASMRNSTGLIAHEMAHQWFGDTVTCEDWSYGWLNEGFATFMPLQYTLATQGMDAFQIERSGVFAAKSGPAGGAARLFMLKEKLGDKRFWKGIHDYLETYKYKTVTNEKFFGAMSKSSGEDLTPFMNEWFPQRENPQIGVTRSGPSFVFAQKTPAYAIDPEAWFWTGSGWVKKRLHFSETTGEVRIEVDPELANAPVFLDPEGHWVLTQTSGAEAPMAQRAKIFDALPTFAKARYTSSLRGLGAAEMERLVEERRNRLLRGSLIGVMSESDNTLLEHLAQSKEPKVRAAAITRLWNVNRTSATADVISLLKKIATSDPISVIREDAYVRYFQLTNDATWIEKAWSMHAPDEHYQVYALNWWATHNKALARERALEALDKAYSEPVQIASIDTLGKVGDEHESRIVFDHLVAILKTTAYQERVSAMNALVAYGDVSATSAIEPITHENMGFIRRAAIAAVAKLRAASKSR